MQHIDEDARALADDMRAGCLGMRIGRTHRLVSKIFDPALRPLGLTMPQLELLSILTLVGQPMKPGDLAELSSVERSTMSRNLALMQDKGWIATTDTSPTGRSMAVTITEAGTRQLAAARPAWDAAQAEAVAALGVDAARTMDQWISRLVTPPS